MRWTMVGIAGWAFTGFWFGSPAQAGAHRPAAPPAHWLHTWRACWSSFRSSPALRGVAAALLGRDDEAIAYFGEVLQQDPANVPAYLARAYVSREHDSDQAIADCTAALKLNSHLAPAYTIRGDCYRQKAVYRKAIADCTAALRLDPDDVRALYTRGWAYLRLGQPAKVIDDCAEITRRDRHHGPEALFLQGMAFFQARDPDRAAVAFTELIRRFPQPDVAAGGLVWLGTVLLWKGEYVKGMADWAAALLLAPGTISFHCRIDRHHFLLGLGTADGDPDAQDSDPDELIADCTARLRRNPANIAAYFERAYVHYRKEEYDAAVADYTEVIRLDALDAEAYLERGSARLERGAVDEAIADYTEALRLGPGNAKAYQGRGGAYHQKKNYARAIADYGEALRLEPGDHWTLSNRALAFGSSGDDAKAIADYSELLRLNPRDVDALSARASRYQENGDNARAVADYTAALRIDPNNVDVNNGLAWLLATGPTACATAPERST